MKESKSKNEIDQHECKEYTRRLKLKVKSEFHLLEFYLIISLLYKFDSGVRFGRKGASLFSLYGKTMKIPKKTFIFLFFFVFSLILDEIFVAPLRFHFVGEYRN